jgi:hypothetical protein
MVVDFATSFCYNATISFYVWLIRVANSCL